MNQRVSRSASQRVGGRAAVVVIVAAMVALVPQIRAQAQRDPVLKAMQAEL